MIGKKIKIKKIRHCQNSSKIQSQNCRNRGRTDISMTCIAWPFTFLAWCRYFNKMWRSSEGFMGPNLTVLLLPCK